MPRTSRHLRPTSRRGSTPSMGRSPPGRGAGTTSSARPSRYLWTTPSRLGRRSASPSSGSQHRTSRPGSAHCSPTPVAPEVPASTSSARRPRFRGRPAPPLRHRRLRPARSGRQRPRPLQRRPPAGRVLRHRRLPDDQNETNTLGEQGKAFAERCKTKATSELPHVGTVNAARDMDVLRAALGDNKLTYYGASYGTYLGAFYAEQFPKNIRALVLDGAVDPQLSSTELLIEQAKGFETALRAFADDCVRSGGCPFGTTADTVIANIASFLAATDKKPLSSTRNSRKVTESLAVMGIARALYVRSTGPSCASPSSRRCRRATAPTSWPSRTRWSSARRTAPTATRPTPTWPSTASTSPTHRTSPPTASPRKRPRGSPPIRPLRRLGRPTLRLLARPDQATAEAHHRQGRSPDRRHRNHPRPRNAVQVVPESCRPALQRRPAHLRRRRPHRLPAGQLLRQRGHRQVPGHDRPAQGRNHLPLINQCNPPPETR